MAPIFTPWGLIDCSSGVFFLSGVTFFFLAFQRLGGRAAALLVREEGASESCRRTPSVRFCVPSGIAPDSPKPYTAVVYTLFSFSLSSFTSGGLVKIKLKVTPLPRSDYVPCINQLNPSLPLRQQNRLLSPPAPARAHPDRTPERHFEAILIKSKLSLQ